MISVANFGPLGTGICSGPNVVLGAGTNVMEAGMATVGTWGLVVAGFTVFEPLVATTTMSTTTSEGDDDSPDPGGHAHPLLAQLGRSLLRGPPLRFGSALCF